MNASAVESISTCENIFQRIDMLELLFGIVVGTGIGTFYHERTQPCFEPVLYELAALKNRIQDRLSEQRQQPRGMPRD